MRWICNFSTTWRKKLQHKSFTSFFEPFQTNLDSSFLVYFLGRDNFLQIKDFISDSWRYLGNDLWFRDSFHRNCNVEKDMLMEKVQLFYFKKRNDIKSYLNINDNTGHLELTINELVYMQHQILTLNPITLSNSTPFSVITSYFLEAANNYFYLVRFLRVFVW